MAGFPPDSNWMPQGTWSPSTTYYSNDVVFYSGSSYVALATSLNIAPGTNALKWQIVAQGGAGGGVGGSTGQVQFNDAGSLGGDAGLTYDKTTDTLTAGSLVLTNALPVAQGGSGAATAAGARANFGLNIGSDVQAYHVNLAAFSGLIGAADKIPYFTAAGAMALFTATSFFRSLGAGADAAAVRTTLGLGSAALADTGTGNGNVPLLDVNGKLQTGVLPALAISATFVVNTQAAMLALTAEQGDVAVRTDLSKSFILKTNSPGTLADWQELLTPTDAVSSVNGHTGAVTGLLEASNNLSDLASATTARNNLGLAAIAASGSASDLIAGTLSISRLADGSLTYAKIQNVSATSRLMGRVSAGAGVMEELTPSQGRTVLALDNVATLLDAKARVGVRKNSAGSSYDRRRINLIEGSGVTITIADDAVNEEVGVTIAASGGGGVGSIIAFVPDSVIAASTTTYYQAWLKNGLAAANEARIRTYLPVGGTISKMKVWINQSGNVQPASGSLVITLYKNGAATALTVTIAANATVTTLQVDNTNSVTVAEGDYIHLVFQNNATGSSVNVSNVTMKLA